MNKLRVLLAEDDPDMRALVRAVFAKPFEVDDPRTAVMNVMRPYFRARATTLPDPNEL